MFASVEPLRLRTWEDVAHEFLTQFVFSANIDAFRRELKATRQSQMSLFLHLSVVGRILRIYSCNFQCEELIARGLWTDTAPSPDSKGKKSIGSSNSGHDTKGCAALHHAIRTD
ncbi:hypothetical protein CK203_093853 [Vitis vinifera]|uniref:Retrotransposon gag domain-containing protein n=1 Tax=Vitis vinifera TaxID=29760 RepID=A0A438EQ66_VITVI|nr:hypothetical protein CK203_093853 [Vitis vinifera]